jgi:hypothetical protein
MPDTARLAYRERDLKRLGAWRGDATIRFRGVRRGFGGAVLVA